MERILIVLLLFNFLICFAENSEINTSQRLILYKKNTEQYRDVYGRAIDINKDRAKIEECLHIPQRNYKLEVKVERVARFNYSIEGLIYGPEKPNINNPLSFNELLLVDVEGNMYFSGAEYMDKNGKDMMSTPKKYQKEGDVFFNLKDAELESIMKAYNDITFSERIFSSRPMLLSDGINKFYFYQKIDFIYLEKWLRDILIIKKDKSLDIRILPYTDYFIPFGDSYSKKSLDSKNRIYLGLWSWDKEDYRKVDRFQVLVYDFEKDTMYFIEWLKPTEGNETIIQVSYVVGDDDAIYVQVVADAACTIYRITPLWDAPMERIEYRPMFYEFYPEIKEKESQAAFPEEEFDETN
ncbi:MAG TPA: hypothetical protein PLW34_11045 [Termitinemataceae bacterium]|uniref:hypothetical protein n=1 Tax=Treponema sp. J25 TaxID=2094121 RepID=UPI0010510D55|nr:hypothetical protein [Treponema sp. J25]TCW60150.1 hypothetical protein C5O22_13080 [Treponema sp. J25]HOK00083.1 hypothetical protein [Termitinemataceae bacterium]HOM24359.1 hypothetical protein [Termitinemataceae bacterium]HPQ01435.1 hypothetical protein [Termitinemataceae bacterium]